MTERDRKTLRRSFLFADTPLPEDAEVHVHEYVSGDAIYSPGEDCRRLGILLEGRAIARKEETDAVLNVFSPPDVFGAAALFGAREEYGSRILAKGRCRVAFFLEEAVEELLRAHPDAAMAYIRYLSDKIRFLNRKVTVFTSPTAESRLAAYLLERETEGTVRSVLPLTKLSSLLSVSRASLYRVAGELEEAGILRREGKDWRILDRDALEMTLRG